MKKEECLKLLQYIDDKYILEANPKNKRQTFIFQWKKIAAIAASVLISVIALFSIIFYSPENQNNIATTSTSSDCASNATSEKNSCSSDISNPPPPASVDKEMVRSGYSSSGNSEPTLPFWCAYQMKRSLNEKDENINVDLSFGIEAEYIKIESEWKNCNRFVVGVRNQNDENFVLKELTAEQFFTEKYKVEIDYCYSNISGEHELVSMTYNYSNTTAFEIPMSLCNKSEGYLIFYIYALNEKTICGGGIENVFYKKINGTIQFQNFIEYYN